VRSVGVAFWPEGVVIPSYAWLGDTITAYVTAGTNPVSLFCYHVLYTSMTAPLRFRYTSTDATVATVSERGLFTGRALGVTRLVATTAGISDSLWVIVAPALASLRVTATPGTARVGDTITVQVDALDADGAPIIGAQVQSPQLIPPSDRLAIWLPNDRPYPPFPSYTYPTPVVDRLVVQQIGVLAVVAVAPHDTGRPIHYVADSAIVSIAPP
jgi:hypothetical protein